MPRVLVDGDSCPSRDVIRDAALEKGISVIVYCDLNHIIHEDGYEVKYVGSGFQAVDMVIANEAEKKDLVVTGDYGVAAMCLAKGSYAVSPSGFIYDNDNMDRLLYERHVKSKMRKAGIKSGNPRKRTKEDDKRLYSSILHLLNRALNEDD